MPLDPSARIRSLGMTGTNLLHKLNVCHPEQTTSGVSEGSETSTFIALIKERQQANDQILRFAQNDIALSDTS